MIFRQLRQSREVESLVSERFDEIKSILDQMHGVNTILPYIKFMFHKGVHFVYLNIFENVDDLFLHRSSSGSPCIPYSIAR